MIVHIQPDHGAARQSGHDRDTARRYRLLQCRQCGGLQCRRHRAPDPAKPIVTSSVIVGAVCRYAAGTRQPDAARGDASSSPDTRG